MLSVAAAVLTLGLAGCGSSSGTRPHAAAPGFGWLRSGAAPATWPVARIADGAAMPYPPGWRRGESDPGTATAVRLDRRGHLAGYLNFTPERGNETLAGWPVFRVDHNGEERDRHVTALASAERLRFRSGSGSCVRDSYTTFTGARFIEIACLVVGPSRGVVIVGAAPPGDWRRVAPQLERAVAGVT